MGVLRLQLVDLAAVVDGDLAPQLDAGDGLDSLAKNQRDLRVSVAIKERTLRAVVRELKAAGYRFVTLMEASATVSMRG